MGPLDLSKLTFLERRTYTLNCNWKVYVDNYLDGGYHVPHLHKSLNSVLEYVDYTVETQDRFCVQSSPIHDTGADAATAAVRQGRAYYFWQYPNFMINCYEGVMDTNLVLPLDVDRCQVIFDFYFQDVSESRQSRNCHSIEVSERIQNEDVVVWYTLGVTHVARPEEFPVMPTAHASVRLVPEGFFVKNPALDVPDSTVPTAQP